MIWVAISWGDVIISHSLFQKFYFINQINMYKASSVLSLKAKVDLINMAFEI